MSTTTIKETQDQYKKRLADQRERSARNYKDRSDDYKAKRRERDREYRRKKRQNENEEERKERLKSDLYYYSNMSDDRYFTMRDKKNMEIRMESNETRQKRLYNKRLSYSHCLSKLTEDERSAKQKSARERTARWKNEANNTEKDYKKAKHRDYMKRRRFYYEGKRSERERRVWCTSRLIYEKFLKRIF